MPDELSQIPQGDRALRTAPHEIALDAPHKSLVGDKTHDSVIERLSTDRSSDKKLQETWSTVFVSAPEIARHTVTLLLSLCSLGILHLTIKYILNDPKFFGLIPIQWVVDVGDIALLLKYICHLVMDFDK